MSVREVYPLLVCAVIWALRLLFLEQGARAAEAATGEKGQKSAQQTEKAIGRMVRQKNPSVLQSDDVHAALSSISAFLTQLGLTSTARSLDSELEKKSGCRLLKSIEEPKSSSALDMLLLAALDPAHDPEHSKSNAQRASQRPSVRQQYGTVKTRTTGEDRYSSASFRTNSRSFAARLRAAEVGGGGLSRDSRQLQTAADKVRISHCEPVALLRGHREPLVHKEQDDLHSNLPWRYFNLMPGNIFRNFVK